MLRELFHVMVWAGFRYSPHPDAVPTQAQFDPALAAKAAPLSREELVKLAQKFAAQDEAYARALAEKDELAAAKDAEIAALQQQIRTAQQASTAVDQHDYSEAENRDLFIDLLLHEAGWELTEARDREYEVTGMPSLGGQGFVDYVLWGADGLPAGPGGGQAHPVQPGLRAAAGQALRRLLGSAVRPAAGDLLYQRVRALAVGRRLRLPAA